MHDDGANLSLAVIASSSAGNASVLRVRDAEGRARYVAIDAGLSPRRTFAAYAELGVPQDQLEGVLLTHLDGDHWHSGWLGAMPRSARLHLHARHLGRAERVGATYLPTSLLAGEAGTGAGQACRHACGHARGEFELMAGVQVRWVLGDHDDHGSVAYRIEHACGASVGYLTDAGRTTPEHAKLLAGVGVLAIESNYCPRMQVASDRPQFLKDRVVGGFGHLSNEQSARLVRAVSPRDCVVLLHLSEQCNTPALALQHHAHGVPVHVCGRHHGTGWLAASSYAGGAAPEVVVSMPSRQGMLFG
jgi:phosphoribosyl 1,2-cyclic phosphodiesterase